MSVLRDEMAAYEAHRADLEAEHLGKWAVVHAGEVTIHDTMRSATNDATRRFGRDACLIREIGQLPVFVPPVLL